MKRFSYILLVLLVTVGAVAQQFARINVRLGPSQGVTGGHTPHGDADYYDFTEGVYGVAQNITPLDAVPGALMTRRSVRNIHDFGSPTYRVVNLSYLPHARISGNTDKGAFIVQFDDEDLDGMWSTIEYDATDVSEFDSTELVDAIVSVSSGFVWPTAAGDLEPGSGQWYVATGGRRIWMPGGLVRRSDTENNFDAGGPAGVYLEYFERQLGASGGYEGLFYHPDEATDVLWANGYSVVPEKPYAELSGTTNFWKVGLILKEDLDNPNRWRTSGKNYFGYYRYWLCPVDADGEVGPPIQTQGKFIPAYSTIGDNGGNFRFARAGLSIVHRFQSIDRTKVPPNIVALRLYGEYKNPDPTNSGWTTDYPTGFGLDVAPTSKTGIIAEINLNGRQFDPPPGEEMPAPWNTSLTSTEFPRSSRFNYFPTVGDEDGWIGVSVVGGNLDEFTIDALGGVIAPHQFNVASEGYTGADSVYVEVKGENHENLPGVWKTTNWSYSRVDNEITVEVDSALYTGTADIYVRFCYPWTGSGSNNVIQVWDFGPPGWVEAEFPFPKDATQDFNEGYPFYEYSCENPAGDRRLAWSFTEKAQWDTAGTEWDVVNRRNVLLYTTNAPDGTMQTKRFALSVNIGAEITGAEFFDDTRFVVSTPDWSQYGEFVLISGQWVVKMGRRLEYGNSARYLVAFNETVYGLDADDGLWALGYDASRIRTDVAPVGDQRLLFSSAQAEWFSNTFGSVRDRLYEAKIVVTPEFIRLYLPEINTGETRSGSEDIRGGDPQADFNFRRFGPGIGDGYEHSWLSLYRRGSGFLSYDFALYGGSTYLPAIDPIIGPHGQVFFHTMYDTAGIGGMYVDNRTRRYPVDQFNAGDDEVHTALEFGVSVPEFPPTIAEMGTIYSRIGAKPDSIQQIISVSASEASSDTLVLWSAPRISERMERVNLNGSNLTTSQYTVKNNFIIADGATDFAEDDSVVATYYADVSYDVDLTPVWYGDEKATYSVDGNVREGWLYTENALWGEYWKVLVYNNSAVPLSVKGMSFNLTKPVTDPQLQASEAITDTTGYGVYETTVPITE